MLSSGIFSLPLWGAVLAALVLTHITIAAVTIYLHRSQCHRAVVLHAIPSHFFRFWLWLTTGMVTVQWIAVHRKHHATSDTPEDPHSPQVFGIHRVLWGGMLLYTKEAGNADTLARYGAGAPEDWVERRIYSAYPGLGILLLPLLDMAFFGVLPGLLVYGIQMAWIPFLAAGVINGMGHYFGYRTYACDDASTNIVPWGILIGGEELHNNHHAYVTSARFSTQWYEIDVGWIYIRLLEVLRLAKVRRIASRLQIVEGKPACDLVTLTAVLSHRHEILMGYDRTIRRTYAQGAHSPRPLARTGLTGDPRMPQWKASWLRRHQALQRRGHFSPQLNTLYSMGEELSALWEKRTATREELLRNLQSWCARAEDSAIAPLQRFARDLRRYS